MIPFEWIQEAQERIKGIVVETPLTYDDALGVFFKWENQQVTGSFKLRGAANKIFSLSDWEREQGLITCSAGNHGQGCALAAQRTGVPCEVYASLHAIPVKIQAMQALGAIVHLVDGDYVIAEKTAIHQAEISGKVFISPYNDIQVIAGQGTIGLELSEQTNGFEDFQSILIPVGGGGLLAGIGASLQLLPKKPRVIGIQSESSAFMHALFYTGSQSGVKECDSLADGLAGAVDPISVTIPLVKHFADSIILVSEKEIKAAIRYCWEKHHQLIEGSAAVALAAILAKKVSDLPAVIVISGGNIQPTTHQSIIRETGTSQ